MHYTSAGLHNFCHHLRYRVTYLSKTQYSPIFLNFHEIYFRPVPPRRPEKNTVEPINRTIRLIFLHQKSFYPSISDSIQEIHAVKTSDDLCGTDTFYSF